MENKHEFIYIFAYFFALLSGIISYLVAGENERLKFHSKQAIILGIVIFVIGLIPIVSILTIFIWIYGLYLGIQAYNGKDIGLPFITTVSEATHEKTDRKKGRKEGNNRNAIDEDHIKALKIRYAKGEITKKQFQKMKKDLEE